MKKNLKISLTIAGLIGVILAPGSIKAGYHNDIIAPVDSQLPLLRYEVAKNPVQYHDFAHKLDAHDSTMGCSWDGKCGH